MKDTITLEINMNAETSDTLDALVICSLKDAYSSLSSCGDVQEANNVKAVLRYYMAETDFRTFMRGFEGE